MSTNQVQNIPKPKRKGSFRTMNAIFYDNLKFIRIDNTAVNLRLFVQLSIFSINLEIKALC